MQDIQFYAKAFVTLLLLVNPLEGIPVFLGATQRADAGVRDSIARRAPIAVTAILLGSVFLGNGVLRLFDISIGAFQLGGGALLCWVAFQMTFGDGGYTLGGGQAREVAPSFAVVPLAIPLMAGPGAISGAILYGTRTQTASEMALLGGVIALVGLVTYASLIAATPLVRLLKTSGIDIATRIMGIVIAAIAVEMMAHGASSHFGLKLYA
jgi:multiple antibiotic resistance protein